MAIKEKAETIEEKVVAGESSPPRKKTPTLLIVGGGLLLLALGGGGTYALMKFMAPSPTEAKAVEQPASAAKGASGENGAKPAGQAEGGKKMGPILEMDPFIVNLADADPRFLKVTVKLEMDSPGATTEATERLPQVRDTILVLLSSKEAQNLKPTAGKLQLRDEILLKVNALLSSGQARNAYFTEFVVQ